MATINFSIIIPHYGIPELLVRCLRSIPMRNDVQVIVVDDGSPNADEYLHKYPELRARGVEFHTVRHQGKAGAMRNIGLEHAVGKWVLFVDADDLLTDNATELFDAALDCPEDIVFHPCLSRMSNDLSIPANRMDDYQKLFQRYALDGDESPFRYGFCVLHGKLFRRDFIVSNNLSFRKTRYSNDVLFSARSGFCAKSIKVVPIPMGIVTQREGSLASSKFSGRISRHECLVRTFEDLKARHFLANRGVTFFARESNLRYMDTLRRSYRFCYCLALVWCLFLDWPLAKCHVRRDIGSIARRFAGIVKRVLLRAMVPLSPLVLITSCGQAPGRPIYIAHAGGEIDGHRYTNCREAVCHALACGVTHIELDLRMTSDGHLVAVHDWKNFRQMCSLAVAPQPLTLEEFKASSPFGKYTPLTAEDIALLMDAHPEMHLVTDKTSSPRILERIFSRHRARTVVECFSLDDYRALEKSGFTCYYSSCPESKWRVFRKKVGNALRLRNVFIPTRYAFWYLGAPHGRSVLADYCDGYGDSFAVFTVEDKERADRLASSDRRIRYVYIDRVE